MQRLSDTEDLGRRLSFLFVLALSLIVSPLVAVDASPNRGCGAALDTFVTSIEHFPPEPPWSDDVYIVGTPASGLFTGQENAFATREAGGWSFRYPCPGDTAYLELTGTRLFYQPFGVEQWVDLSLPRPWSIGEIGARSGKTVSLDDNALAGNRWLLLIDGLNQELAIELPAAESVRNDGREVVVKNADPAFPIEVRAAGQLIEGVASVIVAPGGDVRLISAGDRWLLIGG